MPVREKGAESVSPAHRTILHLQQRGCLCDHVERRITHTLKRDWLGFADIIAASTAGPIAVQATSSSNFSARLKKMEANEYIPELIKRGWSVELYGWDHRDEPRIYVWG